MDSKTRAELRSLASTYETIAQVGKDGIGDAVIESLDAALNAREMIKIGVLRNSERGALELAEELAAATKAEVVTVIGSKIVLYRRSSKEGVRHLLETQEKHDPKRKPNAAKKTNFKGEHFVEEERRRTIMKQIEKRKSEQKDR